MYGLFFNYALFFGKKLFSGKKNHFAIKKLYFRFLYGRRTFLWSVLYNELIFNK